MNPHRLPVLSAVLTLLALACAALPSQAELPPTAYAQMQQKAPVEAKILVIKVTSEIAPEVVADEPETLNTTVTVQAKVLEVMRGEEKIKKDSLIEIMYQRKPLPEGMVGPGPIPLIEAGETYTAYLDRDAATAKLFLPAAKGQSFVQDKVNPPPFDPSVDKANPDLEVAPNTDGM